ncbi:MAG: DUF58 domain-containing protein [Chloroflexi bacterium]|nr:MAG: DUF58 domain-containing protein [Phototrophicales bacterium]RMF77796.1 MAG: DUF58 domain-containing protein [Chloroflexota bacterium]
MTLTPETLRRIRHIELRTRRLVNESFAGAYHSVFKGRGIAFDSVRAYTPGDDVRDIDWNVTARAGEPFVKNYTEERELTVMLMLDASASNLFGTVNRQKRDLAAELGAVLAFMAISNNDKVGLLVFSDQIEQYIAPRKGRKHVLRLIRDLLTVQPTQTGTDLGLALRTMSQALKRRAIIFLVSDFLVDNQQYQRDLQITGQRHDVIAIVLSDPLEQRWPDVGLIGLHDAENADVKWVDTGSTKWRKQFARRSAHFQDKRDTALLTAQIDRIDICVEDDYVDALTRFFQQRVRRLRQ